MVELAWASGGRARGTALAASGPCAALAVLLCTISLAHGQAAVNEAIAKGVRFLMAEAPKQGNAQIGYLALPTMALLKAGAKPDDPVVRDLVERVRTAAANTDFLRSSTTYDPAVVIMALTAADPDRYYAEVQRVADQLMARQNEQGAWHYANNRGDGDTSQSQYAVLALWEAASVGIEVPIEVWDRALYWFITRQDAKGGFTYHPRAPTEEGKRLSQGDVRHSMSVAGLGTMIICRSQLPFATRNQSPKEREMLILVEDLEKTEYERKADKAQADNAIDLAERWMAQNLVYDKPNGPLYYYLYGIERYGSLAERKRIGQSDWYAAGSQFILSKQQADGSWRADYPPVVDTSFALLFLERSTEKTLERIRITKLGKGTMVGGRGLPTAESAGSGLMARRQARFREALKAPVEDLLNALVAEDADPSSADKVAATFESLPDAQIVKAVAGNIPRLRQMARDPRPGVRRSALWALAKSRDLKTVPVLIAALSDSDPQVYRAARDALRHISRKTDPLGLPDQKPDPKTLAAGVRKWQEWFASLRVQLDPDQLYDE